MPNNEYIPVRSTIREIVRHTENEWTFRMTYDDALSVKPSQFFEISLPKCSLLIMLFWQNLQCRLHPEKKTVPAPFLYEMHGSSHL